MTAPAAVGWNRPHEMLTISIRTPSRNQNDLAAHSRCLRWVKPNHSPPGGSNVAYGVGTGQSLNAERAASFRPRTLRTSQSGIGQPRAFSSAPIILAPGVWPAFRHPQPPARSRWLPPAALGDLRAARIMLDMQGAVGWYIRMAPGSRVVPMRPYRQTEPLCAFRHHPVSLGEVSQQIADIRHLF